MTRSQSRVRTRARARRLARVRVELRVLLVSMLLVGAAVALSNQSTSAVAPSIQVATGEMLGASYNRRWFYLSENGGPWQPTYSASIYNPAARGKLMNFRAANALFDDESRTDDDPEGNTSRFISWVDDYAAHGVLAYTVSLQGANPNYTAGVVSAFHPDGALKPAWMARAARVIEAANANGQIVILTYFYQRQDQVLTDANAVRAAVANATDWLIAQNYRNVVIEIANEYDSALHDHSIIKTNAATNGIAELINLAKSRFANRGYRLPVSASTRESAPAYFSGALRDAADLVLVHGNLNSPSEDGANVAALHADSRQHGPIVMNEDRQGTASSTANETDLNEEKVTATNVFKAGGSWGLMWQPYNQGFPMRWAIGTGTDVSGDNKANYFNAVLDHIKSLTFATAAPSPSASPSVSPSSTPSPSASATPSPTVTASATPSPTVTASGTPEPTSGTPTVSPEPTAGTPTVSPEPTAGTPTPTPTPDGTPTGTPEPTTPPTEPTPSDEPPPPTDPPAGDTPTVTSMTLINAETDQPVPGFETVQPGAVIDISEVGTRNLSMRANVAAPVGSVRWGIDANQKYRIERTQPYAFSGDRLGNYHVWTMTLGTHRLTAYPFASTDASGEPGIAYSLTVTLQE